jgi:small subunit ribosomal protein S27e
MTLVPMPKSKFIRVLCKKCGNEQIIFNKASIIVKCLKCGEELAKPTGGEIELVGKFSKVLS